jgi:hypothetical protein
LSVRSQPLGVGERSEHQLAGARTAPDLNSALHGPDQAVSVASRIFRLHSLQELSRRPPWLGLVPFFEFGRHRQQRIRPAALAFGCRFCARGRTDFPRDQRTASTYIFGAICPKQGKGAALILPSCNIEAMNLHLAEIAKAVAPGAHAVLLVDQAGWHLSARLLIPANITILALPPKCPELNPVENIWQYMRDNWLSNRVFKSYDDIVDHCCYAWNTLVDRPWKIMSIGLRQWAHEF